MFCPNCGKEIDDKAVVCPNCGVSTGKNTVTESISNTIAIVGFILSFFVPIAGLICSIMGHRKSNELNGKGKGLALAGIIISAVSMVFYAIYLVVLMSTLFMTA